MLQKGVFPYLLIMVLADTVMKPTHQGLCDQPSAVANYKTWCCFSTQAQDALGGFKLACDAGVSRCA